LKTLGILQKVNNFFKLCLGFINPSDIRKRGFLLLVREQTCTTFPKRKGLTTTTLHLAHEENPETN
jgi:hypothetical protein